MPKSLDVIALNNRLLAAYVLVTSAPDRGDIAFIQGELLAIRDAFQPAQTPSLTATFHRYLCLIALHLTPQAQSALQDMLAATAPPPVTLPAGFAGHAEMLAPLAANGLRGISVVTCSMNRTQNLIKAIPSWLANPQITEVLVVDWSSRQPVEQDFAQGGITDPRIRIVRVEDEPRWILSYAFNAGFRAASCDTILKVDADIVLSPDFFQHNQVSERSFIAGNWRTASDDQAHVNGFFFTSRKALQQVGGFNEYITTYGWDDDDIYDRMMLAGMRRCDVAPGTIAHLEHDDEDRIGELGRAGAQTVGAMLTAGTKYMIRRNRYLAQVMPYWDATAIHLPFRVLGQTERLMTVRREGWVPSAVAPHIQAAGRAHALTELIAWRLGRRVFELDPARIELLVARSKDALSRIDVEVALVAPQHLATGDGRYLVLDLAADLLSGALYPKGLGNAFAALIDAAHKRGLTPVLRAPYIDLPHQAPQCLAGIALIPSWEPIGEVARLTTESLFAVRPPAGQDFAIALTFDVLAALSFATPELILAKPKLFLDAQHGLGNRLRALGSAAAIAAASDRELVVIWQPDDHCDGRFSDLFDYKGAVIEQRFVDERPDCDIYNYMPNEPGADKDALIRLDTTRDIYARTAFVLNNPHSTWETENRFLQGLTPVGAVCDLIASVRHPNDLSAHVRMEAGAGLDHNTYDRPENWRAEDHALIHEWRAKSHFSRFLHRIDALIAQGRANRIFLAADLPDTYLEFQQHYGDRLAWLPRSLYDRSAAQLHYALADALLLSRSPLLLGSTWSSFSELAMRLAPQAIAIEMSGKDF